MKKYILILMLFVSPVQAQTTIKEYYEPLGYYTQLSSVNTLNTVGIVTEIEAETAIEKEPSGIISAFKNASNGHVIVKFAYRVMHSASTWWNQTDQSLIKTKPAIDVPLSLSMVSSSDYDFAVIGREVQIPDNILQALAEETLTDPDSISCAALLDFGYVLPCQYPPLLAGEDTSPLGTCKNGTAATYNDQTTIGTNWTISQCLNAIDSRYHLYTGASNPRLARTTCSGTSTKTIRIYMRWDTAQSSFMDIGHFRWTTPEPCFQVMLADPISTHVQGSYDYKNPTTGIPEPDESFTLDMLKDLVLPDLPEIIKDSAILPDVVELATPSTNYSEDIYQYLLGLRSRSLQPEVVSPQGFNVQSNSTSHRYHEITTPPRNEINNVPPTPPPVLLNEKTFDPPLQRQPMYTVDPYVGASSSFISSRGGMNTDTPPDIEDPEPDPDPDPGTGGSGGTTNNITVNVDVSSVVSAVDRVNASLTDTVSLPDVDEYSQRVIGTLTDALQGVGEGGTYDAGIVGPLDFIKDIFPAAGSCTQLQFTIFEQQNMGINMDTCGASALKTLLEFFLYAVTAVTLYYMALSIRIE